MTTAEKLPVSVDDYLKGEQSAFYKHEYLNGDIWAMVGASDKHVTIAGNLFFLLKQHLKDSHCRPYISDMKVNIKQAEAFFYPDVLVTCDPRDRKNDYYKEHPIFIAEVLSPSTEAFDRGDKFKYYRLLPDFKEYWLIDAQKMSVDCFVRMNEAEWALHSYDEAQSNIPIAALDGKFAIHDLYSDVF